MPATNAIRTSCDRLPAPIFSMTRARWISTVRGLIPSSRAIALLERPSTSCSQHLVLARGQRLRSRRREFGIAASPAEARGRQSLHGSPADEQHPGSNGFSTKSRAPSFIASDRNRHVAVPGDDDHRGQRPALASAPQSARARPSQACARRSRRKRPVSSGCASRKTPRARRTVATAKPSASSSALRESSTASSSSMMMTCLSAAALSGSAGDRRAPRGTPLRRPDSRSPTACRRARPRSSGRSRARCPMPPGLVVTNGWNRRAADLRRECRARCRRPETSTAICARRPVEIDDLPTIDLRERIHAVADQIGDHLLDLDLVHQTPAGRFEAKSRRTAIALSGRADRAPAALASSTTALTSASASLGLALGDELTQAADDLPGPAAPAARSCRAGLTRAACRSSRCAAEQSSRGLGVVDDGGEWLVQLVRQRRGHLAHGR